MPTILNHGESSPEQWPPLRLLKVARAGSLLVACQFLSIALRIGVDTLHFPYSGMHLGLLAAAASILLLFAPALIGSVLIVFAFRWLSDGLIRLRWTDSEIEEARLWADSHELSRPAKWLLWSFVIGEIAVSYAVNHLHQPTHLTITKVFFDSMTLFCVPSLIVSMMSDKLREE